MPELDSMFCPQVATTLNDEIRRLAIIVDEFDRPFHTDETSLNIYKKVSVRSAVEQLNDE